MQLRQVLFVGPMWKGSTCVPRARGLQRLGLDLKVLDSSGAYGASAWEIRIGVRTFVTPSAFRMNGVLLAAAERLRPNVIWIEKGDWVHLSTLRRLRQYAKYLVHYNTDDLFGSGNHFWLARMGLRSFDVHLTTNRFNVAEITTHSGVPTMRVGMGFEEDLHIQKRDPEVSDSSNTVTFVGHWEKHTEQYLVALMEAGVPVDVWGHNWRHAKSVLMRKARPLEQEKYASKVSSSAFALCSLSRRNRNESTGRSFEIPAIGGCLLAERTAEHEYFYRDGREAILFSGTEDLVRKVQQYLRLPDECRSIAAAGRARCLHLDLSWEGNVAREWPILERMLIEGRQPENGDSDSPFWPGFRRGEPFLQVRDA